MWMFTGIHVEVPNCVCKTPRFSIESQGFTKDEGQRQRFPGSMMKGGIYRRRRKRRLLYLHPKLSSGLLLYKFSIYYRIGIACRKMIFMLPSNSAC